jgi:hypothetical protein
MMGQVFKDYLVILDPHVAPRHIKIFLGPIYIVE